MAVQHRYRADAPARPLRPPPQGPEPGSRGGAGAGHASGQFGHDCYVPLRELSHLGHWGGEGAEEDCGQEEGELDKGNVNELSYLCI